MAAVTRSRLPDVGAGKAQHLHHAADPPRASRAVPSDTNPPWRGEVYRLAPEVPLFMRRGPRHFWRHRVSLGYGPAFEPTLKRSCAVLIRLVGRMTNTKYAKSAVCRSKRPNVGAWEAQYSHPSGSNPLRRGWVFCLVSEALLFGGMPTRIKVFLKLPGACGLCPCTLTHFKKSLCHTRPVGRMYDKY